MKLSNMKKNYLLQLAVQLYKKVKDSQRVKKIGHQNSSRFSSDF